MKRGLLVLLALVLLVLGLRAAGLGDYLTLDQLRAQRGTLAAWVAAAPLLAPVAYVAAYVVVVALSLPGATVMTLAGGLLFGAAVGTGLAVTGATLGAGVVFLIARRLAGPDALAKLGDRAARLAAGLQREAFTYLLVLRLVPVFPFVLVNLVPAAVGMALRPYLAATALGILPGTAVFALAGAGLGRALEADGVARILTPEIILALFGLAATALLAIPLRRWLARR